MDSQRITSAFNAQAFSSLLPPFWRTLLHMNAALAIAPPANKSRPKRAKAYAQASELQQKLADAVNRCHEDMTATQDRELRSRIGACLASMVRGWDILEERKRILRGRPLPGHLRPDLPASQRRPVKRVALLASVLQEDKESLLADGPSGHPQGPEATETTGSN